MIERIADDVLVEVRQDVVALLPHKRRVPALQYVVCNSGLQRATVRLDFSQSRHIQLFSLHLSGRPENELVLDVSVEPLQRCHVAHVVQAKSDRGYVRVKYSVTLDTVETRDDGHVENSEAIHSLVERSANTFASIVRVNSILDSHCTSPFVEVTKWCEDVNRWNQKQRVDFVDPVFPPSHASLAGSNTDDSRQRVPITWRHLREVIDESWCLLNFEERARHGPTPSKRWNAGVVSQDSWVCAHTILDGTAPLWCKKWFGEREIEHLKKNPVRPSQRCVAHIRLCREGRQWVSVVIDLFVPVLAQCQNGGLISAWPASGEYFSVLLQKAYAKLRGNYAAIASLSTQQILQELTGVPIKLLHDNETTKSSDDAVTHMIGAWNSSRLRGGNLAIVSFGEIDCHHCSFELVHVAFPTPSSSVSITVRDPIFALQAFLLKHGLAFDIKPQDCTICLKQEEFFRLGPRIVELRTDLSYSWRRRKICTSQRGVTKLQIAISCSSVQDLIIQAFACSLSGGDFVGELSLEVDRVEDTGATTRIHSARNEQKDGDSDVSQLETQVEWTAMTGEYVVSITLNTKSPSQGREAVGQPSLAKSRVWENSDLLHRCLDQDMDGIVSKNEIMEFLRLHEQLDSPSITPSVNAFMEAHGFYDVQDEDSALTKENLIQVYESLIPINGDLQEELATLIWGDLNNLLGREEERHPSESPSVVHELCCVISSDRSDAVIAILK